MKILKSGVVIRVTEDKNDYFEVGKEYQFTLRQTSSGMKYYRVEHKDEWGRDDYTKYDLKSFVQQFKIKE